MKTLWQLFWTFLKIGSFTFGGGYAMLPLLQREIVEKKKWSTEEELISYYAIGQTTPGIIAINTATFIGYNQKGIMGALAATIGLILPGVLIIILIAKMISELDSILPVKHALSAIKVAVTVLILEALLKLQKASLIDIQTKIIFFTVLLCSLVFRQLSPAVWVVLAALAGLVISWYKEVRT